MSRALRSSDPTREATANRRKKTPFQKLKASVFGSGDPVEGGRDELRFFPDAGGGGGSGPASPPIAPRAPLVVDGGVGGSARKRRGGAATRLRSQTQGSDPRSASDPREPERSGADADERQRRLRELYERRLRCRAGDGSPGGGGSADSDDELGRQLRLAALEDRRESAERRWKRTELGRDHRRDVYRNRQQQQQQQQDSDRCSQQQTNQPQPNRRQSHDRPHPKDPRPNGPAAPPAPAARTENSTQSTRSETSSEGSSSLCGRAFAAPADGAGAAGDSREPSAEGDGGRPRGDFLAEERRRLRRDAGAGDAADSAERRRRRQTRATTPPPGDLGAIQEERSSVADSDCFPEFREDDEWGTNDENNDFFDDDDEGNVGRQFREEYFEAIDDALPSGDVPRRKPALTIDVVSDVSYHDDPSVDMMSSLADTNDSAQQQHRRNGDGASPTDSSEDRDEVRGSGNRGAASSDSARPEARGGERERDDARPSDRERGRAPLRPHQEEGRVREEKKRFDPPGTFIDDVSAPSPAMRGGRARNRTRPSARDPSAGGDAGAGYSASPFSRSRGAPPRRVARLDRRRDEASESPGKAVPRSVSPHVEARDRPGRTPQQQDRRHRLGRDPSQSASNRSDRQQTTPQHNRQSQQQTPPQHNRQPQQQTPQSQWDWSNNNPSAPTPDENDQWDIEFVSPNNPNGTCEASSLGNLTNEYDDVPPDNSRGDDDTATNTMNTVDLVAEVKRVWRHVQKYERKKKKREDLMMSMQYRSGQGEQAAEREEDGHEYEGEGANATMESLMSHFRGLEERNEASVDETGVSDLTSFSRTNNNRGGAPVRQYGGGVVANRAASPLDNHIQYSNRGGVHASPGRSSINASHASTEKDVAFVNDGVDLFFDQTNQSNAVHPRVPLSHHHRPQAPPSSSGIPLSHHRVSNSIKNADERHLVQEAKKASLNNLSQPYDMTKSRSTGTALSSKTQKTSNRNPGVVSMYTAKHEEVLSGMGSQQQQQRQGPPSSPPQEHVHSHKVRVEMARRYMKQHGGARFPRSRSPNVVPPSISTDTNSSSRDYGYGHNVQQQQQGKHASFRVT